MFDDFAQRVGAVRVKICGICHAEDAQAAVEFGADAIGLNGYAGSKRYLEIEAAGGWLAQLPPHVRRIAVLVDPTFAHALAVARLPFIDGLQLHGSESAEFCGRLAHEGVRFAKAVPVSGADSLARLPSFQTSWIVLDSAKAGAFGGTGLTFPWPIARSFIESHAELKVVLAGGLTPENVAEAIRAVRPFCVDVTTGVEASPGRKDHARVRSFIEAAHRAAASA
jgi:phosphoribosylanthranilate isomerase